MAKVEEYELAGVQEYVIVDRREQRGQVIDEVLGYELRRDRFRPLAPDDDGRILCRTVGLWISLREGQIVLEDAATGERLLSSSHARPTFASTPRSLYTNLTTLTTLTTCG